RAPAVPPLLGGRRPRRRDLPRAVPAAPLHPRLRRSGTNRRGHGGEAASSAPERRGPDRPVRARRARGAPAGPGGRPPRPGRADGEGAADPREAGRPPRPRARRLSPGDAVAAELAFLVK